MCWGNLNELHRMYKRVPVFESWSHRRIKTSDTPIKYIIGKQGMQKWSESKNKSLQRHYSLNFKQITLARHLWAYHFLTSSIPVENKSACTCLNRVWLIILALCAMATVSVCGNKRQAKVPLSFLNQKNKTKNKTGHFFFSKSVVKSIT